VYVQTPSEEPTRIDAVTQRLLADTLTLANQLGATVFTFKGQDIADTILRFAREYRVGQIVIGKPRRIPWWRRLLLREKSVAEQLIFRAEGVTITVIDANAEEQLASDLPAAPTSDFPALPSPPPAPTRPKLGEILTSARIRLWNDPVSKEQLLRELVEAATAGEPGAQAVVVLRKLAEREAQGSTFLNEGVALPHARVEGLTRPLVALGLTHAGVLDAPTEKPIEAVFLMLSPEDQATNHLQLLAAAGRLLQNRDLRKQLRTADSAIEAAGIIADLVATKSSST
jgi:two-component system sensor histidine kinase KdpD